MHTVTFSVNLKIYISKNLLFILIFDRIFSCFFCVPPYLNLLYTALFQSLSSSTDEERDYGSTCKNTGSSGFDVNFSGPFGQIKGDIHVYLSN